LNFQPAAAQLQAAAAAADNYCESKESGFDVTLIITGLSVRWDLGLSTIVNGWIVVDGFKFKSNTVYISFFVHLNQLCSFWSD
jgi:hypothetical protein